MKKIISLIIATVLVLGILLNVPSNLLDKNQENSAETEYASLPGVKVPPLPPKE